MKLLRILSVAGALAGATGLLLRAADPAEKPAATGTAYSEKRNFAQPVRPDAVGTNIAANRAFWGAPPPMPHSFAGERDGGRACLECHALENRVEKDQEAIAPVPHAEFTQCQQCHVNGSADTRLLFRENNFVGLNSPGKGDRAHPYAPPTIPHKTFMRDNCLACHGPAGKQRIATSHLLRSQCQQCHVSDASLNLFLASHAIHRSQFPISNADSWLDQRP